MTEASARVCRVEGDTAWVVSEAPASCGVCAGKGCGNSVFARLLHAEEPEYPVLNRIDARPGDAVVVAIEDGALLGAAARAYLLPLALLLGGALAGSPFGEAAAVLGGLFGLAAAILWLRRARGPARPAIIRLGGASCAARN
jgi:sigma-E factor negative regulatory protein RseC